MRFQAIIFDMDGLMVDSEKLYRKAEDALAAKHKKKVTQPTIDKMMGRKAEEAMQIFCDDLDLKGDIHGYIDEIESMMTAALDAGIDAMPGLFSLLDFLRGHYKLAIATGSKKIFVERILKKLGLVSDFEVVQDSDNIRFGKPHPEIYQKTLERLSLKASDTLVLEDSENGCRAAKSAGCFVVAVPNSHTAAQNFSMADSIIPSLDALIPLLKKGAFDEHL